MIKTHSVIKDLQPHNCAGVFEGIYKKKDFAQQSQRWTDLVETHSSRFSDPRISLFSTPGRSELGGNHTDHNNGKVITAGIDLDVAGVVSSPGTSKITLYSQGHDGPFVVSLDDIEKKDQETGTPLAIIRGVLKAFADRGHSIGGFNASVHSTVMPGSGLSSSAAFEVWIATVLSSLFNNGEIKHTVLAQTGQWAENNYFGKPCGLMDQMACAHGGIISIDLKNPSAPLVQPIDFSFLEHGYHLAVIHTGGSHADLTDDYASIPDEMKKIAAFFAKENLREVAFADFHKNIANLRKKIGDRAVLRAMHFHSENDRVERMKNALQHNELSSYFDVVNASGKSSAMYLQNVYSTKHINEQGISLALALTETSIGRKGACRVHGGGFAGTIQAYIPEESHIAYTHIMEDVFGEGSVTPLGIRGKPSCRLM